MVNSFGAQPFRHAFGRAPARAVSVINRWVETNTDGKVRDLMPPGETVTENLIMIGPERMYI